MYANMLMLEFVDIKGSGFTFGGGSAFKVFFFFFLFFVFCPLLNRVYSNRSDITKTCLFIYIEIENFASKN